MPTSARFLLSLRLLLRKIHLPRQREAHVPPNFRFPSGSLCEGAVNRRLTEGESFLAQISTRTAQPHLPPWLSLWESCHEVTERAKETNKTFLPWLPLLFVGATPIARRIIPLTNLCSALSQKLNYIPIHHLSTTAGGRSLIAPTFNQITSAPQAAPSVRELSRLWPRLRERPYSLPKQKDTSVSESVFLH